MDSLLRRALNDEPLRRPPVWFMRQAGRYLPEYREIRGRVSFLELCRDSDLALEVTLQPLDRFDLDAAIAFSDILPVLEALGHEVLYESGVGPTLPRPLRDVSDVRGLVKPDVSEALPVLPETIRKFCRARPHTPILGFAGAPFTLFCYLVEGGGSRNWRHAKSMLWSDSAMALRVLEILADVVGDYLQSQIDAGAEAVQMFDTWAGILSNEDYERFALPAAARALGRVSGAPRLYYTRDCSPFLRLLPQTGADAISIDWRTEMAEARSVLGSMPVQGNLDPLALFAPTEIIREKVHNIIRQAGPCGHVFNLGHGVLPDTPIAGVQAMINAVREWEF
ncbi:MAG: uroporphyrinogen decarboxylase [Proteobacteria bacterium]|nr:uroporphyrinogen decarboxylase [Pseudomonadota bacterium]